LGATPRKYRMPIVLLSRREWRERRFSDPTNRMWIPHVPAVFLRSIPGRPTVRAG